jgi:NAD(P)-dependent dehydrogenase (short-subunit alcohol dehydrogenase family)
MLIYRNIVSIFTLMSKIIIVTGGSRGIGAATAILAAERGYTVCFTYLHNQAAANRIVHSIEQRGGKALAVAADVASETDVMHLFNQVDERLGSIAALVNNAGVLKNQMKLESMDIDRLKRVFETNIIGSFLCAREAVKRMSTLHSGTGGAIVNVSSGAAKTGSPHDYIDYAASKGAIDTMTIGLAKEVANEGIRVNAVRPGIIDTEIHASGGEPNRIDRVKAFIPMKRGGQAIEVAQAILWLLSDESSYTTGSFVDVAGGI